MKGRGRQSVNAAVIPGGWKQRPDPPDGLTERQAEIWRETVSSEDPEFFATGATRAILADYCRHRESAERFSVVIDQFKPEWLNTVKGLAHYRMLVRGREIETRASVTMATKLRLTNQSRWHEQNAMTAGKRAAKGPRPWEVAS